MIVSMKVKLVSSFAVILVFIFGGRLVDLFPPSTAERTLALLFVTIVGVLSTFIFIVAKTEEDKLVVWGFSANKAANCPHCGGAIIADLFIDPKRQSVESLELIDFSLYRDKTKDET